MADVTYGVHDPQTLLTGPVHEMRPSRNKGKFLWVRLSDQKVLSLQPDGTQQYRDPGTDGAFEQFTPQGNTMVFTYYFDDMPHMHVVAFQDAQKSAFV